MKVVNLNYIMILMILNVDIYFERIKKIGIC